MKHLPPPTLMCRLCAAELREFGFRCGACGAWDSAVVAGDAPPSRPTRRAGA